MSTFSTQILDQADLVASACKTLNFKKIVAHDSTEVEKLKLVIKDLSIATAAQMDEDLADYAKPAGGNAAQGSAAAKTAAPAAQTIESKEALMARRQALIEDLSKEGFNDRVGKVYNSFSSERTITFKQVPHRRGLPPFDLVLAPDFAPVAGLHGIFLKDNEVMSIILAADGSGDSEWHILKRKTFNDSDEMLELVTLIAAGFDLP